MKPLVGLLLRRARVAAGAALIAGGLGVPPTTASAAGPGHSLSPTTRFFVPPPAHGSLEQASQLLRSGDATDASLILEMESTPQAVWLDGETAAQIARGEAGARQADVDVARQVRQTMLEAAVENAVPVFVAYNIPGRDCGSFSAGGARNEADYDGWTDSLAGAIGEGHAVVLLEPDSLGLIPSNCDHTDNPNGTYPIEVSGPTIMPTMSQYPAAIQKYYGADVERFAELNHAVGALEADPNTVVYLDGVHSAWLNVPAISQELLLAGVQRVQGFFTDVSNYQFTPNSVRFGTWISDCIAYETVVAPGNWVNQFGAVCPGQYYNGWSGSGFNGTALNPYGIWSNSGACTATSCSGAAADLDSTGENQTYASLLGATEPITHFLIDTSRNGLGPDSMQRYAGSPFDQPGSVISTLVAGNFCNPPGAGLGDTPTASTGNSLVDAYLWVKIPGQSDGQCDPASGVRAWDDAAYTPPITGWPASGTEAFGNFDPLWSIRTDSIITDPAAGAWFPQQALQLAQLANPPLA
ncbi:MAG TPA: glycoside hydrolase family 6 protein [Candidatus Binatia bacterium]|nr:glycoside hydrolase family 6 protein [Candidatus Binatia bacterium]